MTRASALLALNLFAGVTNLVAQTPAPAWQKAAGPPITFEVASIRQDKGEFQTPSFALSADDWFRDPQGRFHADFNLPVYINFAYKLWLTPSEEDAALAKLPGWVKTDRFLIEAVAPLHATKDQYRLMMQALLAERFGLKLHFEQTEQPVLAMVLTRPGKPGPHLLPHAQGPPCDAQPKLDVFPRDCFTYAAMPSHYGMWVNGSRATTMDLLANFVGMSAGLSGEAGRRVVDKTGLNGAWDFTLEFVQLTQGRTTPDNATGPSFLEALHDQLGLNLKPTRAIVTLPVIDHVERPNEN